VFMEIEMSELYELLINCLKKNKTVIETADLASWSPKRWQDLLALSAMQRVTPLLWHRLKQKGLDRLVPDDVASSFREASRRNTLHNLRLNGELRLLLSKLKAESIPLILLKGIVLSNTIYENISLREMNDIDVLARPEHLERITDILVEMGYRPFQPICVDVAMQVGHHLPRLIKKEHAGFEIHWNLTEPGKLYHINPQGLWERAVPVQIAGCQTFTLSPEDMLLHLCLHTSYLHQFTFGLRPFYDIAETVDHSGSALDWQTVVGRAYDQGWQRGVYLALRLAVELADASVPVDILEWFQPANLSDNILATARAQIFTDKSFATSIPVPFAQLLESRRLSDKIDIFFQRVFLPRAVIANAYSVPEDSLRIYGCYLRRFYDVLRRHGRTFKKFQKNDSAVKSLADRKKLIADWMD
ncbi:MAG: nucleotidyltransferase family protein, partial [Syntrophaceae bacterium]